MTWKVQENLGGGKVIGNILRGTGQTRDDKEDHGEGAEG